MPIRRYLEDRAAFGPADIDAMSKALEEACKALQIDGEIKEREVVATRIIDLARQGVLDWQTLSARVVEAMRSQ